MELFKFLLILHIAGGAISLFTGFIVMLLKKGSKIHTRIGTIYFYSLLLAAIVSFPMSYLHSSIFLFIVGVFTTYMLLTGKSYLSKNLNDHIRVTDWVLAATMLVFGLGFLGIGCYNVFKGIYFGVVMIVFGGISIFFVIQDWINFTGKASIKNYWLTTHLQRMVGSYIASATAFIVVNNHIVPGVVAWLLPTIILSPLIAVWTRRYMVNI
jgi:hypothetical protein